jgi:hypothetical protein
MLFKALAVSVIIIIFLSLAVLGFELRPHAC